MVVVCLSVVVEAFSVVEDVVVVWLSEVGEAVVVVVTLTHLLQHCRLILGHSRHIV